MYQSGSPSPTPTLILNRTFSKPPHHFPSRQPPPMWDIIMLQLRVQASTCVGGRGGVTTHAAVKLRNAGQLGQAWRYCVVKTFPSPSISFPSAWQHAPRPAPPPPPMCSGAYRAWPGCVTRVRPRGVGWEVGAGVARVISDILRRRMLGMYRSMTRSHGGWLGAGHVAAL